MAFSRRFRDCANSIQVAVMALAPKPTKVTVSINSSNVGKGDGPPISLEYSCDQYANAEIAVAATIQTGKYLVGSIEEATVR